MNNYVHIHIARVSEYFDLAVLLANLHLPSFRLWKFTFSLHAVFVRVEEHIKLSSQLNEAILRYISARRAPVDRYGLFCNYLRFGDSTAYLVSGFRANIWYGIHYVVKELAMAGERMSSWDNTPSYNAPAIVGVLIALWLLLESRDFNRLFSDIFSLFDDINYHPLIPHYSSVLNHVNGASVQRSGCANGSTSVTVSYGANKGAEVSPGPLRRRARVKKQTLDISDTRYDARIQEKVTKMDKKSTQDHISGDAIEPFKYGWIT